MKTSLLFLISLILTGCDNRFSKFEDMDYSTFLSNVHCKECNKLNLYLPSDGLSESKYSKINDCLSDNKLLFPLIIKYNIGNLDTFGFSTFKDKNDDYYITSSRSIFLSETKWSELNNQYMVIVGYNEGILTFNAPNNFVKKTKPLSAGKDIWAALDEYCFIFKNNLNYHKTQDNWNILD